MRFKRLLLHTMALGLGLALALPALATTVHPDVITPVFSYTGIQETSSWGDPEPACCFGAGSAAGNSIVFFPPNFTAFASGAGGNDQTGAQLQFMIEVNDASDIIESVLLSENGDAILTSFPPGGGTAATGTFASMAGFVTILDTQDGLNIGTVIPFIGTFDQDLHLLPTDEGANVWSATADIDLTGYDATKVFVSLDNDLFANSELGTTAKIQKKVTGGLTVTPTPEPATGLLIAAALLGLGIRRKA